MVPNKPPTSDTNAASTAAPRQPGLLMSEDSDSKLYRFPGLEDPDGALGCRRASSSFGPIPHGASGCSSIAQLHRMGGYSQGGADLGLASEGSDSSGSLQDPLGALVHGHRSRSLPEEDVEMKSSGSSGSGTESHGNESHGNESRGNQSHGNESTGSSNGNSKDSALFESSGSNKRSVTPRSKGSTSSTLNTLKYAMRCVKQVEANEEYYQLLRINDSQPSGLDVSSYTIEEIDSITSEYTLKNNAASILNCKRDVFKNAKFVEFLTPQDVSVFYSFTTPYRLPSWSMCTGAESSPPDCMQEKSFFCRISMSSNDLHVGMNSSGESVGHTSKVHPEAEGESSKTKPRTFQEICKGVDLQKSQEQQLYLASSAKSDAKKPAHTAAAATTTTHTTTISSIDGLQRAVAMVRPKDLAAPLSWRDAGAVMEESRASFQEELAFNNQTVYSYQQINCLDSVIRYLESCNIPITMKRKCRSSSITTSSNSDDDKQKGHSSTWVSEEPALLKDQPEHHRPLGDADKKPSEATTAVVGTSLPLPVPDKPESVVSITSQCSYSSTIVHVGDKKPQPESEVIEEMIDGNQTPGPPLSAVSPPNQERESYKKLGLTEQGPNKLAPGGEPTARRGGRNKKTKSKRTKQIEFVGQHRVLAVGGLNQTSWSALRDLPVHLSSMAYPAVMPGYPVPVYPGANSGPGPPPQTPRWRANGDASQCNQAPSCTPTIHPAPYTAPVVTPILALILPNYIFPSDGPRQACPPSHQSFYQADPRRLTRPWTPSRQPAYAMQPQFTRGHNPYAPSIPWGTRPTRLPLSAGRMLDASQGNPRAPPTPQSSVGGRGPRPPPRRCSQSCCSSSPAAQLLQLEESQPLAGEAGQCSAAHTSSLGEGNNSDANSSSSDMMDIFLQEDSRSGTGSATSGSMGSGSNGCGTSNSGTSNSG
ncbi:hypothetical protein CRUP_024766, partial [Coryphaenoides rupestris]